ncbi:orotate phosphoribosyltransferase [Candidatus Nitrotoga sp. HW29]|uniref:orotate phosphoribosyltransferase n=1 Tax=Candidatus Nitrotoga sp. HW29 TaxID=2886963 RepID=UPI001EF186F9|nr:orotate phosphoribosyltransferase [Candidatus Nitrotoga sp. HW29]CAH1903882.1 orotate phosphoribosyltransferase [Candidatus Nitrotoga sp. HW29]
MSNFRQDFIHFAIKQEVLCFGEFKTKAGRLSPYFFNAGLFNDGESLKLLTQFYAQAILFSKIPFDMLYGPAYKGIPLAAGTAIALAEKGCNVPYCFNRKEAKDHGEGGSTVGAKLQGRVLIIDDVISAGTSVRESIVLIRAAGAIPCGVVIALDRMELGQQIERNENELSAAQEVQRNYDIPVVSIATLNDLLGYLQGNPAMVQNLQAVQSYRDRYGIERK